MDTAEIYIQSPGTICICVDEYDHHSVLGRIYYPENEKPVHFNEIGRLFIEIDRILDEIHFPESSTSGRSFKVPIQNRLKSKEKASMKKMKIQQKGGKGTFVVQVQFRQHATWQGKVLWAEKNETVNFRSALELLKLIDSALDESAAAAVEKMTDINDETKTAKD